VSATRLQLVLGAAEEAGRVFTNRLQHEEAPFVGLPVLTLQKAFVDEGSHAVDELRSQFPEGIADRFRRLEGESSGEDAESAEECLLLGSEQAEAPVDRAPHRVLPVRHVPRTRGEEVEALIETSKKCAGRHHANARRRKFERQRQAIEAPADLRDRAGIVIAESERRIGRFRTSDE
jgi:hypothetical protein